MLSSRSRLWKGLLCVALLAAGIIGRTAFAKDLVLAGGFPPITDEDRALKEVPFAPGAPAVMLLNVRQTEWAFKGGNAMKGARTRIFQRIKILNQAGVEAFANLKLRARSLGSLEDVEARTILPDGKVIDAGPGINKDITRSKDRVLSVAFPQVQPGAILDFRVNFFYENEVFSPTFAVQQNLPTIESRMVFIPPTFAEFKTLYSNVPRELAKFKEIRSSVGQAFVWSFPNVPALAEEPNSPNPEESGWRVEIIYSRFGAQKFDQSWSSFNKNQEEAVAIWMKRASMKTKKLAAEVVAGKSTVGEKIETIGQCLRKRVRLTEINKLAADDNPDGVLTTGSGTSTEIAMTALVMLQEVGIKARAAMLTRRGTGFQNPDFPIPNRINDMLLEVATDGGPVLWSPASRLPFGSLAPEFRGIYVMPLDGESTTPYMTAALQSKDNQIKRTTKGQLDESGNLAAETIMVFHGAPAGALRDVLVGADQERQREAMERWMRDYLANAVVQSVTIQDLEDESKDMTVAVKWTSEGWATSAGSRMLVRPLFFDRIPIGNWNPEARLNDLDLGDPRKLIDFVTIQLPKTVKEIKGPGKLELPRNNLGQYSASVDGWSGKIVANRVFGVEDTRFSKTDYAQVRAWYLEAAKFEDQSVVLTLEQP